MKYLKRLLFSGSIVTMLALTAAVSGATTGVKPCMGDNALVQQAIEDLARRESLSPDDIEVLGFEEVVWPDTSMGCPYPEMRYQQVPQDGSRIVLRVRGELREYHSGGNRAPFLCQDKRTLPK